MSSVSKSLHEAFTANPYAMTAALVLTALLIALWFVLGPVTLLALMLP